MTTPAPITAAERAQIDAANAGGRQPVVFIHGLWLLASSWALWQQLFEENGYATVAPSWPDDPATVAEGRANPQVFAGKGILDIADHIAAVIGALDRKPAVIGHSFGGMFTQMMADRGLAVCSVPIDPAQTRGVLPLPLSTLKSAFPVLGNPLNRSKAVMLSAKQFRYAFANAVSESEAAALYETFPVPGAGKPLFQAAVANLNPKTEARVDFANPARGPMKIISGENDHTVPHAIAHAIYTKQSKNPSLTEFEEIPGVGHSLVIDSNWPTVAAVALDFVKAHAPA